MARLNTPLGKRARLTFYIYEQDARRLEQVKQQARAIGRTVCFKEDFGKWLKQQLDQLERELSKLAKQKEGRNG
jgi:hypothetical protein